MITTSKNLRCTETLLLIFILLAVCTNTHAQSTPHRVEPGLITNGGEFGLTISPDGNEAFWVKSNGGRDTLVIMHSIKQKGRWTTPVAASFSGRPGEFKDIDPMFSPDGKMILFQSTRAVPTQPNRKGFDIWAVRKTKNGWSDAYHLGDVINTDDSESFASITKSGNIYFMKQNPDGVGSSDIYVSKYEKGAYQPPQNIGLPINTSFRESNPFISPNEDYMIYFSSDSTGYGDVDLFITIRKDGVWTTPINLGQPINSGTGEFCPFVHEKQRKLYFSRTTVVNGARRVEDLYVVDFDVMKYLK